MIRLGHWIVLDFSVLPDFIDRWTWAEAELDNESRHDAKEVSVVEEAILDQVVKTVGA